MRAGVSAPGLAGLAGRAREQSMLRDCLDVSLHGHARLVLIGSGLDEEALVAALSRCVVGGDDPALPEHAELALTRYRTDLPVEV